MSTTPANESISPSAPVGALVSVFQDHSVAVRATRFVNWERAPVTVPWRSLTA